MIYRVDEVFTQSGVYVGRRIVPMASARRRAVLWLAVYCAAVSLAIGYLAVSVMNRVQRPVDNSSLAI